MMGFLPDSPPLHLQNLIPATLQRHIHSCGRIYHMYKDQEGLQAVGNNTRNNYIFSLVFSQK